MIHWRRKLIDAAKAAVTGTQLVGGAVFEWRGHAIEAKHKRWIVVIPRSESPTDDETTQDDQGVELALDFVAAARTPDGRDEVSLDLQEAIGRAPIAPLMRWTGTELSDPDVSGDGAVFEATHSYVIRYQHSFESPGTD